MERRGIAFNQAPFFSPLQHVNPLADAGGHAHTVAFFRRPGADDDLHLFRVFLSVVQHGNRSGQRLPDSFLIGDIHGQGPVIQRPVLAPPGTGMRGRKPVLCLFPKVVRQRFRHGSGIRVRFFQHLQCNVCRFRQRPVLSCQLQGQPVASRGHFRLEARFSLPGFRIVPVKRFLFSFFPKDQGTSLCGIEADQYRVALLHPVVFRPD